MGSISRFDGRSVRAAGLFQPLVRAFGLALRETPDLLHAKTALESTIKARGDLVMMNRTITLTLALAAGFLGGTLSRYVTPVTVFAQAQSTAAKEIRAQRFILVDENDKVRGTFAIENDGNATIKLFDETGRETFSVGPPFRLVGQK
jgi:hypothetical protein